MDKQSIKQKVNEIFIKLNITKPPVDVYSIANAFKIKITHADLDDGFSGFLMIKNSKATIAVNEHHHPNRQRFTIAHELGHYFLHRGNNNDLIYLDNKIMRRNETIFQKNRDETSSHGTDEEEIQANLFAAELLMPEEFVKETLEYEDIDLSDDVSFYLLSKRFSVSEQAMGIRLGRLNLIDI